MHVSSPPPTVSVCIVTYNQAAYIGQCLQSVIDQHTSFPVEIVVGDDCSTDGTTEIVRAFAERYPERIVALFHSPNLGGAGNYFSVHNRARGKYIAHLDGDDYLLPGKLQAQADFLDSHPRHNVVWHRMTVRNETSGLMVPDAIDLAALPQEGFRRQDLMRFITVGLNSAKMYRAAVRDFPHPDMPVLDYLANVEQIGDGLGGFAGTEPLGVYRAGIGVASSGAGTKGLIARTLRYLAQRYPQDRRHLCCAALMLLLAAAKNRRWAECRLFLPVVLSTLHPGAVLDLVRQRAMFGMFSLPAAIRKGN